MVMTSSVATLFQEAERLDNRSLEVFIEHILSLRVQRKTSDKQKEEADLLQKINKSLSIKEIGRFNFLNEKHSEEDITEQEYAEFLVLIKKIEKLNVKRLKYLISLAQLRNVTVVEVMKQLGLSNPINA
jgi:Rad3-related DNA helicase